MGNTIDQRDALITIFRAEVPDIPAGDLGVTLRLQPSDDLDDDQFPHLFIGGYLKNVVPLDWQQEETTSTWVCLFYTDSDQTDTLNLADQIEAAINASSNLGGLVDKVQVRTIEMGETVNRDIRVLRFAVETVGEA